MASLRILHITASYKPAYIYGGPIMSVSALCEALAKNEAYVEVFTTTANGKEELPLKPGLVHEIDGVKVSYFKRLTKDHTHFSPALLKSLRAKVKEFDAVHIHAWWNLVSVLAALIGIFKGTPVIVSPRGMLSSYSFGNKNDFKKKLIHNTLGKRLLQQCHVHATAQSEALAINEIIKPLSITVIPNFVTIPISVPVRAAKEQSSPIKLLFFSRIEEKKGLDILLQALPHLNFTFSLTIAGTGEPDYIEYLKTLVKNDTIAGRVNWLGFIGVDKFELLSGHHLMVLPSHDENFGNVVIESLSVGTPVLVSDKVGLATYVTDKQLGWAYKGEELAETLNAVSADFDLKYERITNTAPQTIREDFDEKMLVEKYLDLYNCIK